MSTPSGFPAGKAVRSSNKQRRMGPAPIASFEDLNDDFDPLEDKVVFKPMPEIREDMQPCMVGTPMTPSSGAGSGAGSAAGSSLMGGGLQTPSTPRIDISRASSSSHHDSHDSSPERELYGEVLAEGGSTLGLGFKEEGTADLRSSTEELNFHIETGTVQEKEFLRRKQKQLSKLQASGALKNELDAHGDHERKDSTCSDLGLLSISGRTSRLSSIGSAASGGSGVSHISNVSRLSVTGSHLSGTSGRSTSPHKMLVETSFCGSTPSINQSVDIATPPTSTKHEPRDTLEKILLAKSVDPTMAIVAGEAVRSLSAERKSTVDRSSGLMNGKGRQAEVDTKAQKQKPPMTKVQGLEGAVCPEELTRRVENERARRLGQSEGVYMRETEGKFISLKFESLGNSLDVEEKPAVKGGKKASKTVASESEGTYISLKGEPDSLTKETKPTAKKSSGRGSSKGGLYLQETEGKFISLKYSQDYSQDSQDGEDLQLAPRNTHGAKKPGGHDGEGTFISLKSDSLDKETILTERQRSRSPRLASVTKACIEVEVIKQTAKPVATERRADKSKLNNCETEGTYISLKGEPGGPRVKEAIIEIKRPRDAAQKVVLTKVDPTVKIVASLRVDKVSAKPKEEKKVQGVAQKRSSKPVDFKNIPPEGIFISLKPGSSMEEEERVVEKAPPLKDCGKSSRLRDNEGQYMRETEGTFISLKGDLGSSLDREERGVEIPITLNLSEAGKSGKTVQTFSQLVQKEVTRSSKEIASSKPLSTTPSASPKPARHSVLRKDEVGSRTPSPSSSSRKSSFTSLFRRGEVLSPESPSIGKTRKPGFTSLLKEASEGLIDRNRSRSKSKEPQEASSASVSPLTVGESRDLKLKNAKNKSVFTTLFKKKERKRDGKDDDTLSPAEISSPEPTLPVLDAISNVEFTFAADRQCSEPPPPPNDTVVREDQPLDADNLLPSESVMLPTLSQLYRDHKELFIEKPKPAVELEASMPERPKKPALENVEDGGHYSSESERDFEVESIGSKMEEVLKAVNDEEDHERKGIFSQQDSVDEELPYIPTTLPQERSVVVPLVPAKQRALAEVRTCPVERPRSTTPINPSLLDEFVTTGPPLARELKMKISLPREDSISSKKSPRRSHARSWFEFAEQGLQSPREYRKGSLTSATSPSPPPLPPRAPATVSPPPQTPPPPKVQNWINFEEIPERRKPPKRIQTIPSRSNIEFPEPPKSSDAKGVQYSYVNPEDCKCECHEPSGRHATGDKAMANGSKQRCSHSEKDKKRQPPRLEVEDKNSCVSDSSCEYVNPCTAEPTEEFNIESLKVMKPFGMDLDVSSNRSSVVSQDEQPSPDNELPHHVH